MKRFFILVARRPWILGHASLLVSLLFLAALPSRFAVNENTDYRDHYEPVARSLLAGRGVVDRNGEPAFRYPPGYPLLLAGVFWTADSFGVAEPAALKAANVLGMSGSALLVFLIARRLWGAQSALVPWLAWTTYPLGLYLIKQPNSEIPFIVALLGAMYCAVNMLQPGNERVSRCVACGALVGIAMLIRPIAIGLGVVLAALVYLNSRPRGMVSAVALLAGNLAIVAPWEAWLYLKTHSFVPVSSTGPWVLRDGLAFGVRLKGYREGVWVPSAAREVMNSINEQYPTLLTVSAVGQAVAQELRSHPFGVMQLFGFKAARSWYATESHRFELLTLMIQALYLAAIGAATAGAWRSGGTARRAAIALWVIVGYFWAMTIAGSSIVRYMVPAMSLLFLILPAARRAVSAEPAASPLLG